MNNLSPLCLIGTKSPERVEGANKIRHTLKMKIEIEVI